MNNKRFPMLWIDSEAMNGKPEKAVSRVYNTHDYHYGANNKKEIPCRDCSMYDICRTEGIECRAFRNWVSTGDYKIKYRELKLRKCA